ncbi:MAG: hypothetical protein ACRCZH_04005 [Cetobacterium sp.]
MSKRLRNVVNFDARFFTPQLTVYTAEELKEGVLFGLNEEGKAIVCDGVDVKAVGINIKTSAEGWGEAFKFNGANVLRAGEHIDVYAFGHVVAEELEGVKVGDDVFAGANGLLSKTGTQKVGTVANADKKIVRIML